MGEQCGRTDPSAAGVCRSKTGAGLGGDRRSGSSAERVPVRYVARWDAVFRLISRVSAARDGQRCGGAWGRVQRWPESAAGFCQTPAGILCCVGNYPFSRVYSFRELDVFYLQSCKLHVNGVGSSGIE